MKKNFLLILVSIFSLIASAQKNIPVTIAGKKYIVPEFKQDSVISSENYITGYNVLPSIKKSKADLEIRFFYLRFSRPDLFYHGIVYVLKGWRDSLRFETIRFDKYINIHSDSLPNYKLADTVDRVYSRTVIVHPFKSADSLLINLIKTGLFAIDDFSRAILALKRQGIGITEPENFSRHAKYYKVFEVKLGKLYRNCRLDFSYVYENRGCKELDDEEKLFFLFRDVFNQ